MVANNRDMKEEVTRFVEPGGIYRAHIKDALFPKYNPTSSTFAVET